MFALLILTLTFSSAQASVPLSKLDSRQGTSASAETLSRAREFVQFRRGRLGTAQREAWLERCRSRPQENLFCGFAERRPSKKDASDERSGSRDLFQVSEALSQARLKDLKEVRESVVQKALRLYPNWEPLVSVAKKAKATSDCSYVSLLTALGQKSEEFFPDPSARKWAIELYSRVAECGSSESAQKAMYRLALHLISDGKCAEADEHLSGLIEIKSGDYLARAIYWRGHCAQAAGNRLLAEAMKGRLLREYPLSYHGLLLTRARGAELRHASHILDGGDPIVLIRSLKKSELNSAVIGIEALQHLGANDLASELLDSIENRLDGAEASFALYVAWLQSISGDRIGQFRGLSLAFRDDPSLIGRSTLQLFYPLRRYDIISRYRSKIDPYLVAALIRQESGFNEQARSPAGAMGLMQLMPATARRLERVSKRELLDAKTNIRLGVRYFHSLIDRFGGDAELALASYNAGPERVDEWRRRYPTSNRALFFDLIPYKETREYVSLISRNYYWYLGLYGAQRGPDSGNSGRKPLRFTLFNYH